MFDLNVGDVCHKSFNGDSYPYIVHDTAFCRGRKVCDMYMIPTYIDGIQIIPSFDMFENECADTLLIPASDILKMLREKNSEVIEGITISNTDISIVQSKKKDYWHDVGNPHPTFHWFEGMRCARNPCF